MIIVKIVITINQVNFRSRLIGVLAPWSAQARPSAQPPIDMSKVKEREMMPTIMATSLARWRTRTPLGPIKFLGNICYDMYKTKIRKAK